MMSDTSRLARIELHHYRCDAGASVAVIRGLTYPLLPQHSNISISWIRQLMKSSSLRSPNLSANLFLQYNQLHLGRAGYILGEQGAKWLPQVGLGVWADDPSPRLWRREDFTELGIGERPRPLMNQLFRIDSRATAEGIDLFWPSGSVLVCLTEQMFDNLSPRFADHFLARIEEPLLRCFRYYLPLLRTSAIPLIQEAHTAPWLDGLTLYIRQSPEDGGIFIYDQGRLETAYHAMGFEPSRQDEGIWVLSAEPDLQ